MKKARSNFVGTLILERPRNDPRMQIQVKIKFSPAHTLIRQTKSGRLLGQTDGRLN